MSHGASRQGGLAWVGWWRVWDGLSLAWTVGWAVGLVCLTRPLLAWVAGWAVRQVSDTSDRPGWPARGHASRTKRLILGKRDPWPPWGEANLRSPFRCKGNQFRDWKHVLIFPGGLKHTEVYGHCLDDKFF